MENTEQVKKHEHSDTYALRSNSLIQLDQYLQAYTYSSQKTKAQKSFKSVEEYKLLIYVLSKLNKSACESLVQEKGIDAFSFPPIEVTATEYWKKANIIPDGSKYYQLILDALFSLKNNTSLIPAQTETGETVLVPGSWISDFTITPKSKSWTVTLNSHLAPYLLQLDNNMTRTYPQRIMRMQSKYGIILYDYLTSFEYRHQRIELTISDIKHLFNAPESYTGALIKQKFVDVAVRDINNNACDICVAYEINRIRGGRTAITSFSFEIERTLGECASIGPRLIEKSSISEKLQHIMEQISYDELLAEFKDPYILDRIVLLIEFASNSLEVRGNLYATDFGFSESIMQQELNKINYTTIVKSIDELGALIYEPETYTNGIFVQTLLKYAQSTNVIKSLDSIKQQISYNDISQLLIANPNYGDLTHLNAVVTAMDQVINYTAKNYKLKDHKYPGSQLRQEFLTKINKGVVLYAINKVKQHIQQSDKKIPMSFTSYYRTVLYESIIDAPAYESVKMSKYDNAQGIPGQRELDEDELAAIKRMMSESD